MMPGSVLQLATSRGGVPKQSITRGRVHVGGLADDWQHDRKHHGGPDRALCLYPIEHITALQVEGHPIVPGSAGENITTSGLDWSLIRPGVQLHVGDEVRLEVVSYTSPCKTIRDSFHAGRFERISQVTHPGWSRVYARVLQEGDVTAGDAIVLVPDASAPQEAVADATTRQEAATDAR